MTNELTSVKDSTYEQILEAMTPWKAIIDDDANIVIGESRVFLEKTECSSRECNLGNFFTDAMVDAVLLYVVKFIKRSSYDSKNWSNVTIALTTGGNFRVPLQRGTLTYSHLFTMCPFQNKWIALNLKGDKLIEVLEVGVAGMNPNSITPSSSRMLQVSGLRITYNITQPRGERVKEVQVRCQHCDIPRFEKLKVDEVYRIVVADYLAEGQNGFSVIQENASDLEIGPLDLDALSSFIKVNNPIVAGIEGRITIVK